jgi:hypothetical protein
MGWIKGLVAPAAFGDNAQAPLPGMAPQGGPPMGGMPPQGGAPYGAAPYGDPSYGAAPPYGGVPQGGAPQGGMPAPYAGAAPGYDPSALPNAMQWSTGTRTQGQGGQGNAPIAGGPIAGGPIAGGPTAGGGAPSLEARCAQLQHDVESLALFARTLLTMLEEAKVVTRAQFDATKNRLDMLDGKLDDR